MTLFTSRRFLPLFLTQFLGAFNDNLLKNALILLVTYQLASKEGMDVGTLSAVAGGIFILPFFLASATAGQLADAYDRARLTRFIKLAEIGIMAVAFAGFYAQSVGILLLALFFMGMHSTFFGPIKYALLPQHLPEGELLPANSWIEAGTFLAILFGTIAGGVLVLLPHGTLCISLALLAVAVLGYLASRFIPAAPAPSPGLKISVNVARESWNIVLHARSNGRVFRAILGISWFWLVGAVYLSQFAPYVKEGLNGTPAIVTFFLTVFSVGIGAGSFLCNLLLKGRIATTYVCPAALCMALFGVDLYFACHGAANLAGGAALNLPDFLSHAASLRLLADLFLIAVSAGVYIVPLYAIMQHESDPAFRARIIAANNIVNALFMVGGALLTLAFIAAGVGTTGIFLTLALTNFVAARFIFTLQKAHPHA